MSNGAPYTRKTFEFSEKRGFLCNVKVTTVEEIKPEKIPGNREWFDANYIELLLMIDEKWRSPRQLTKYSSALRLMDSSKISSMLKGLEEKGLVESRKEGKSHTQYRRTHKFPKHEGMIT
jgi:DNA-binding transcriptional ArsR family regulator